MKIQTKLALFSATALMASSLLLATPARSDESFALAPPVESATGESNLFNWTEIPTDTKVPLVKATFDQGGYQLYDSVGETIIVPFTNNNLYVMRFARTDGDEMYFVNESNIPTLYLPKDAYLENAAVTGARWYPFSDRFQPTTPVYLGVAPSWNEYETMTWYPHMIVHCGYYSHHPFFVGAIFAPALSLFIEIGGTPYHGWHPYAVYERAHPDFERMHHPVMINNRPFHWGSPAFSAQHHEYIFGHKQDWRPDGHRDVVPMHNGLPEHNSAPPHSGIGDRPFRGGSPRGDGSSEWNHGGHSGGPGAGGRDSGSGGHGGGPGAGGRDGDRDH